MSVDQDATKDFETHRGVPFFPPVMAFHPGAVIREAFAQWWLPELFTEEHRRAWEAIQEASMIELPDGDKIIDPEKLKERIREAAAPGARRPSGFTQLYAILKRTGVRREGQTRLFGPPVQKKMRANLCIDYPLVKPVERVFDIELSRLGEIFGLGFDLYAEVYEADAALRDGKPAPRIRGMHNRQASTLIWGHDFSDLVYEGLLFQPGSTSEQEDGFMGTFAFMIGS